MKQLNLNLKIIILNLSCINNTKKSFRINHTIKNPNFFDADKFYNDYIINHNKKFDLNGFKCDFKLVFINFTPHIKTYFHHNTSIINLKRYLLY